jgi:hypothetical protein
MEFDLRIIRLNEIFSPIINLLVPQTHKSIIRSIEFFVEKYEDPDRGITVLNKCTRKLISKYTDLCGYYEGISTNLKRIFNDNVAKFLFVVWRINPDEWFNEIVWQNFVWNQELPDSLPQDSWKMRLLVDSRYDYDEELFDEIFEHFTDNLRHFVP